MFSGMKSATFFREMELIQIKKPTTALTDIDITDSALAFFIGTELNMGKKFFISLNRDKDTFTKLGNINNVCRGLGSRITFAFADNDSSELFPNGFEEFDTVDFGKVDVFVVIGPKNPDNEDAAKKTLRLYNNYMSQRKLNKFKLNSIFYMDNITPFNTVKNIVKSNPDFKDSTVIMFIKDNISPEAHAAVKNISELVTFKKLRKN